MSIISRMELNDIIQRQEQTIQSYASAMPKGGRLGKPQDSLKSAEVVVIGDGGGKPAAVFKKQKNFVQSQLLTTNPGTDGVALMDVRIADFILSNAPPLVDFFNDVFKLPELSVLVQYHNRVRNYFGSVRHAPSAMFRKHSKDHNNGISLSFIKIAETRMGGNIIALLRPLRLRDPLVATIVTAEFRKLNCWRSFSSLAQNEGLWEYIFKVCRAFYPVMRVLRLADSKIPVMDKLYFYVRMADHMMEKYLPDVESAYKSVVTDDFLSILSQEGLAVKDNTHEMHGYLEQAPSQTHP